MKMMVRIVVVLLSLAAASCWAQTFQTIHTFPADKSEGYLPYAKLVVGPGGDLYGTASEGGVGNDNAGTAFKITTDGAFSLLGNFETAVTGRTPLARLVNTGDGFIYGATANGGGTSGDPIGTVFKLDPAGGPTAAGGLTKIFALPSSSTTGCHPHDIISAEPNVLHVLGNSPGGIWRVQLNGAAESVFSFTTNTQGIFPERITLGADGFIYGITNGTGSSASSEPGPNGTIFKIAPNGSGFQVIHSCPITSTDTDTANIGRNPVGALVPAGDGSFYGAMETGELGTGDDGVIFKISPNGDYQILHLIDENVEASPTGDLLLASDGKLYGVSSNGGEHLYGAVFRVNTDGSGFQVIHHFNKVDGSYPKDGLVQAADGNLYGVTSEGGAGNSGTIFRIGLDLPPAQVNHRPIATPDGVRRTSTGDAFFIDVLANDYDVDEGDTLEVSIESNPTYGTVTVQSDGKIQYTPNAADTPQDSFQYTITDQDGLSATATVTVVLPNADLPGWEPGAYTGLLNLDPSLEGSDETPRGQLIINVSARGIITGKLLTQKKRLTVLGAFTDDGTAIAVVKISKKKKALLFLGVANNFTLTAIYFGDETWSGSVGQGKRSEPGRFTIDLGHDSTDLPFGHGFAIGRVFPSGIVAIKGKLSDGTPISWGTFLTYSPNGSDVYPVFNAPVKGGFCAGKFISNGANYQASLKWLRPPATKVTQPYLNGFSGELNATVSLYTPPARKGNVFNLNDGLVGLVAFYTAGPVVLESGSVTINGPRLTLGGAPLKSLSINRSNGLFSGKMLRDAKSVRFQGVVQQGSVDSFGYYIQDNTSGSVIVTFD